MSYNGFKEPSGITGGMLESEVLGRMDKEKYDDKVIKKRIKRRYSDSEWKKLSTEERVVIMINAKNEMNLDNKERQKHYKDLLSREGNREEREKIVEECQLEGNTERPRAHFARSLYQGLISKFEKQKLVNQKNGAPDVVKLKYFCALGSHLDYIDGVDAYFKLYNQDDQQIARATLDVTNNPNKSFRPDKADIIIMFPKDGLDPDEDREEYSRKVQEIVSSIIKQFNEDLRN